MKASELINRLNELMSIYGDKDITLFKDGEDPINVRGVNHALIHSVDPKTGQRTGQHERIFFLTGV